MNHHVLVTYASKYGATKEIAERIGEVLSGAGLAVDLRPVGEADDPAGYDAVVLGSAVYGGNWRDEAAAYLNDNVAPLTNREVWLFSSGPTGEGEPSSLVHGWGFPEDLQGVASIIHPNDIVLFGGKLDMRKLNLIEKLMVRVMKAPPGDFRDWDAIERWAEGIAGALNEKAGA